MPKWAESQRNLSAWGQLWKGPFRSLPARVTSFVFGATLITSLTVTAISVSSTGDFLRSRVDEKFPSILESASERLDGWYQQRVSELGVFASSEIISKNIPGLAPGATASRTKRAHSEIERYLTYVLESFPQYAALFLLDADGETVLWVGEEQTLPLAMVAEASKTRGVGLSDLVLAGREPVQIASASVSDQHDQTGMSVHALLRVEQWNKLLADKDLGPSGEIFVVGSDGRYITETPTRRPGLQYGRSTASPDDEVVVVEYDNELGLHVVGSASRFDRFGWTVVVEESYSEAFAPMVSAIRRTLGINLAIVLALAFAAFRIAVSIVRPIEALSVAAKQIHDGEKDVVIPESRSQDEVGLLTQAFHDMTTRLATNATELEISKHEIEQANRQLRLQNDELQRFNEVLEQLSITDGLTKLHNHRFFQDQLAKEVRRADRTGEPLALILLDIDHFKAWNDRLGHAMGDQILRRVAEEMNQVIRETDFLARYGGEEFALLAPNTVLEGAISLAEKIRLAIRGTSFLIAPPSDGDQTVTVSAGVAIYTGDRESFFVSADRALYEAKSGGRDCVVADAESELEATRSMEKSGTAARVGSASASVREGSEKSATPPAKKPRAKKKTSTKKASRSKKSTSKESPEDPPGSGA